jgi:superfamily II DNA or RNA helicase/Holliday junction resolvase
VTFLTEEILKGTDWRAVERAVARAMTHCGWENVRVVGGTGDGGGDVVALRREKDKIHVFVVQVKAVMGEHYIGPSAIQEAVDALAIYGGDVAVVATNGDFTRSAYTRRDELRETGFDVRLWNGRFLQELLGQWAEEPWAKRKMRPYQTDIVGTSVAKFSSGKDRVQFVVATGLGKTVIAAEIVNRLFQAGLKRALVLCHAQELSMQLEQAFWTQIDRSIPTRVFFEGDPPKPHDGIDFGLYQTFAGYLSGIETADYDIVVVDEAHHAVAQGFRRCLNHLRPKLLVGMTATPWRGDGENIDAIFGPAIAQVSLVDGMAMGYLAQVAYHIYCDTIDWKAIPEVSRGSLTIRDLNKKLFLPQRDEAVIGELLKTNKLVANPRVIVFCASIEHCRRFAGLLNSSSDLVCKAISGLDRVERNRALVDFAAGRIQAVTAVDVLNEGIDVPDVNILVFLRSTHSRRIFVQQLGRGLRLSAGTERLFVMDFVTDIRRLADVIEMDTEARHPRTRQQSVYFQDGIVRFENKGVLSFVQQWIKDVADLGDAEESRTLKFPDIS